MTQPKSSPDEPDIVLTETQNWASRSHEELYAAVHTENDPGRVGQLSDEWNLLSRDIGEAAQRMAEKVRGTESGWQGQAADAARAAIQELADWNVKAGDTAGSLGARIATQGRVMEVAKTEMPEPVKGGEDLTAALMTSYANNDLESFTKATNDIQAHQAKATSAHELAVQVMTNMEAQSRTIDAETPRFTPPPNPVEEQRLRMLVSNRQEGVTPDEPVKPMANGAPAGGPGGPGATSPAAAAPDAPVPGGPGGPGGGPGGIDGPTKAMPMPQLGDGPGGIGSPGGPGGGPGGIDGPTKAMPMPKLGDGPGQGVPPLGDFNPSSTTPQSTSPQSTTPQSFTPPPVPGPGGGGDHLYQPRSFQSPDGVPYGTGPVQPGNRPGNRPGDRNGWQGQIPPIPGGGPVGGGPAGPGSTGPGGGPGGFRGGPGPVPGLGAGGGVGGGSLGAGGGAGGAGGGSSNLAPGGTSGTGRPGEAGFAPRGASGAPGQPGAAGMGAGPMGAGAQRGRGEDDKERSAKYVQGGPVVEVPGADLPPPVIGEGKKKKRQDQG
ncbi:PPE domain-containing protein [Saccharopolyspora sp. NPDC000359]|uniref:PPE domain-containing protein n=1 Tax=Saccharopolyspora sp. NPDC000359 TaxID=3154251 RepID=UPI003318C4D4